MNKLLLKQIIADQRQELDIGLQEIAVSREIENDVKKSLSDNLIKIIAGVRRCGKSFLARQILRAKDCGYINFDDERLIGISAQDLNNVIEALRELQPDFKYLFFDEIQNIDGWELFVNRLKRTGYNIVITGSNSKLLSKELSTHLTGRHIVFELYPFSFREYLSYKGIDFQESDFYITEKRAYAKNMLDQYLKTGGFPEVLQVKFPNLYLSELYDKIVSRDIVGRYNIKHKKSLREMALYVFSNVGSKITYHKLKNIFEFSSVHTAKNYIDYLEESYLIFQLKQFSFKLKNIVRGARKIYCIDSGMANTLSVSLSPNAGHIMENTVFLNLKRRGKEIYFYNTSTGGEVDFVVKEKSKIKELIQVCLNVDDFDTAKREINALVRAGEELKCKNLSIITWDKEDSEFIGNKEIKYIPLYKWLLI